ncbi:hypothetical protein GCM10025857_14620 [Alicyclobacillus contaminans]|uniref:DUF6504 family protein n=1 Tax=Alicyclobacillus contaminans TaxID=392016 RepID=UPI000400A20E|nr:DUF6504 family protein [Alicyclobacillus contaminans]GMA50105.1 hypothetical protein GCM10025857_14620 [Alicyclobacillus contaminans]
MSRLVQRPIRVRTNRNGEPVTIIDGDRTYTVSAILNAWSESGAWWDSEPSRRMFTVETADGSVFDLEHSGGKWSIYRVWD